MYNQQLEELIDAALADGVLTEKEKQVLFKKAQAQGVDLDEFEMVLDARLVKLQKAEKAKNEAAAPKSNKYGDVRKCPQCGAIVPAMAGVCPECGFEFTGVEANSSSKNLADLLINGEDVEKRKQIIETFPVPLTKADLAEFVTAMKPRLLDVEDPLSNSYFKKYAECIEKIRVAFSMDPILAPYLNEWPELKANREKLVSKQAAGASAKKAGSAILKLFTWPYQLIFKKFGI